MTDTDELYDRLRAADPAADIDRAPDSVAARRVRSRIAAAMGTAPSTGGVARKRVTVALAAALLLVGGAAFATGIFDPDPEQVAAILDEANQNYPAGELPALLSTSTVWCAYDNGLVGATGWHGLAIDEEMSENHLIAACAEGPDQVRFGEADMPAAAEFTVCEAVVPLVEVQRGLESSGVPVIEGVLTADRPTFPFVLGWDADCASTTLDTNPPVNLRPLSSLAPINRSRQVEIGLQAAATRECLSMDRVHELASQARSELDGDWVVVDSSVHMETSDVVCFSGVRVDPWNGTLDVGGYGG